ncbi:MAG TPA: class I SAM-dependent methyltransferase [Vicinamibacterales bacterium]|nr:class I SAM-dependent methyltransferase [Vicinamibacterales bacterium]
MKRTGARTVLTVSYLAVAVSALPACSDLPDLPNGSAARAGAPAEQRTGSPPQSKAKGRLFQAQDLGLLESPDRDEWEKPEQIMDAIGVAEGAVVAELGAAGGWFTLRLARRVGPNGLVYAEDIQPAMLEAIGRRVRNESLGNVKPVLGTVTDPRLPAGIDAILISDAFHEMDDPADPNQVVTLLKNAAQSLKADGRLGVVDWTPGAGGPGPGSDQRADPDVVIAKARSAGLQLLAREEIPPFVYLLVFGRASARTP